MKNIFIEPMKAKMEIKKVSTIKKKNIQMVTMS